MKHYITQSTHDDSMCAVQGRRQVYSAGLTPSALGTRHSRLIAHTMRRTHNECRLEILKSIPATQGRDKR